MIDNINSLKKLKSFHNGSYGEAINMAIKALEKQTPKKPIIDGALRDYWNCPVCNSRFGGRFGDIRMEQTNYCHVCGQKIDWGDLDEI